MDDMAEAEDEVNQSPLGQRRPCLADANDSFSMMGIIYVLSNQAMPGYLKIGVTSGDSPVAVEQRMKSLDNTSVPLPFKCEYAAIVRDHKKVEKALHTAFGDYRVNRQREFFTGVEVSKVKAVIDLLEIKDVTPEKTNTSDGEGIQTRIPKEKFTFKMVDIPIGATLQFVEDSDKSCTVLGTETDVEYEGHSYTITGLTRELKQITYGFQATRYWKYEGETLQARRERLEKELGVDDE